MCLRLDNCINSARTTEIIHTKEIACVFYEFVVDEFRFELDPSLFVPCLKT